LCFQKQFFEFFTSKSILFFSHKLELSIAILILQGSFVVRVFLVIKGSRSPSVLPPYIGKL